MTKAAGDTSAVILFILNSLGANHEKFNLAIVGVTGMVGQNS